jgi:hypothetical protein
MSRVREKPKIPQKIPHSNFGFGWNILDVPGQSAGNKKPAEPIAMRVSRYFPELL